MFNMMNVMVWLVIRLLWKNVNSWNVIVSWDENSWWWLW